jgi:5-(carboxyamino)imidazole ribonucleotide synthase
VIVGVLGGGQLARLLALAGHSLGVRTVVLDPAPDACAAAVARHLCAPWDDAAALAELAACCDVVTYEFENVPPAAVEALAARVPVRPGPVALRVAGDRVAEKALFRRLGMATAAFAAVGGPEELHEAAGRTGLPAILKTRHAGYDGKGQALVRDAAHLLPAWERLGRAPAILEALVPFERELSIVAARGRDGATAFYPLTENTHRDGILRLSLSRPGHPLQQAAESLATRLMAELDYTGVLALELFEAHGALLASEFAPRVHNSGHWTLHGAETSQFENHLRAVLGLPLGATGTTGAVAMVNFIGALPDPARVLAVPHARLEAYGKAPRAGRKVGHATVRAPDAASCERLAGELLSLADGT